MIRKLWVRFLWLCAQFAWRHHAAPSTIAAVRLVSDHLKSGRVPEAWSAAGLDEVATRLWMAAIREAGL